MNFTTNPLPVVLRPEHPDDEAFLYAVYASTREEELALTNWNDQMRRAFLDHQFNAMRQGYRSMFPDGEFLIIELGGQPAGRMVLHRSAAGVRVVILSGDDPLVVTRLAKIVGLRAERVITGPDLDKLTVDALQVRARDTDIFARLSPDQKARIVRALRASGEVVGFMGDGVNDAPGIKAADVGLSVDGATGVARAAADMILLDSDLAVVADGVEEGRRTFANILKYVRMGASSNFGNMLSMAAASLCLPFLPMLATQILLNNLLYDVSEIGIPFDNVHAADIAKPQHWRLQDIVRFSVVMGPLSSVFDLVTFGVLYLGFHTNPNVFRTSWFVESIATQTLVVFLIRTRGRPWRDMPNPVLVISTLGALAVALAIPFSPLGAWFGFQTPPPLVIAALGGIVVVYLVCAELFKPLAIGDELRRAAQLH